MQKKFLIFTIAGLLFFSCSKQKSTTISMLESDSLSVFIKKKLEEKKRILEIKKDFENSRYMQALLKYRPIIKKYSKRYGLDWRLIAAQIMQESKFMEQARSPVGARGLMQLMPGTAQEISRELDIQYILKNPRENIAAGIYHMKKQYSYFPNSDFMNQTKLSLASYNCGIGRIFDAQDLARYFNRASNQWRNISQYLTMLKSSDWEIHLQVWPQGKPRHGYFYGYQETISYVDNIWDTYHIYKKIL